jgi:hypothetical protein
VNDALSLAEEKTRVYREESELWKKDHKLAMAFYSFQDFLEFGVGLFDSITKIDEDWRLRVLEHRVEYDPAFAEALLRVYRQWLEPCAEIEEVLKFFEQRFGMVANAPEFRARWREAAGILTPDGEFFAGDALVSLCDTAIDEHQTGETFDVGRS